MTALSHTTPGASQPMTQDVERYLPFVRRVVTRLVRRLPSHVRAEELMGAAIVGLLEALDRYDPSRASGFEAFAEFRVKGAVLDELRRRDLMSRDARLAANQMERVVADMTRRLGRPLYRRSGSGRDRRGGGHRDLFATVRRTRRDGAILWPRRIPRWEAGGLVAHPGRLSVTQ